MKNKILYYIFINNIRLIIVKKIFLKLKNKYKSFYDLIKYLNKNYIIKYN